MPAGTNTTAPGWLAGSLLVAPVFFRYSTIIVGVTVSKSLAEDEEPIEISGGAETFVAPARVGGGLVFVFEDKSVLVAGAVLVAAATCAAA